MMIDWNEYLKQTNAAIAEIATASPDIVRGYRTISDAGRKTAKLDAKTRELIALAVAVTRQCDGCINAHTTAAIKAGATKEELIEALGVAITRQRWRGAGLFGAHDRRVRPQNGGGAERLNRRGGTAGAPGAFRIARLVGGGASRSKLR